jgi:hypothetical protein
VGVEEVLAGLLPQGAGLLEVDGRGLLGPGDQGVAGLQVFFKACFSHGCGTAVCVKARIVARCG